MKPVLARTFRSAFLALLLVYFQPVDLTAAETMMTIGSGNITGVYYGTSSAVAKMHNKKRKNYGVWLASQSTAGSLENINGVLQNNFDFGIAQSSAMSQAWNGHEIWGNVPKSDLRAVLGLHTEAVTLIAAADAGIMSLKDLKGKRVNIGAPGSSDHQTSNTILKMLGLNIEEDMTVSRFPTYEASEKIQTGDIDAYFYTVGHPNLSVIEASAGERKMHIVPFDQEIINNLKSVADYLSETEIGIKYYENLMNEEPVSTIGIKAILFTHVGTNDEVVYRIVKQVVENIDLFRRQHPAFSKLAAEKMSQDTIVPLHPGAERYFKEAGIIQ